MQVTLKMVEKMEGLLEEADEYITCANTHSDDSELKSIYMDLARCHYDGYEKLSKCCERVVDRKRNQGPEGEALKKMAEWHKDKFDEKAAKVKLRMDHQR